MNKVITLITILLFTSCRSTKQITDVKDPIAQVNLVLNEWHEAAAQANYENYFSKMSKDAIFIGTDATENWHLEDFKTFAKPYFDRGKAWSFSTLERHVYINSEGDIAWFDELLDTQMEICRGSGVLILTSKGWKIQHYVLSMTIPNENVDEVVKIKKIIELQTKLKYQ